MKLSKNQNGEFFVLARPKPKNNKDLVFFYEITDAQNKLCTEGHGNDDKVWTETDKERLVNMRLEYKFLSAFSIFKVNVERVFIFNRTNSDEKKT